MFARRVCELSEGVERLSGKKIINGQFGSGFDRLHIQRGNLMCKSQDVIAQSVKVIDPINVR